MKARALLFRGLLAALAFSAGSCTKVFVPDGFCRGDEDCAPGSLCFMGSCGDPGSNLVMQVTSGELAQELADPHGTQDVELDRPATFSGQIRQDTTSGPAPFAGSVTFKGAGTALLIPGFPRHIETPVQPNAGRYSFDARPGTYVTLAAYSSDPSVPPVSLEGQGAWTLMPRSSLSVDVTFPSQDALARMTGTLVRTTVLGPVEAPMQIQVLEPVTGRPLSQPALVDPVTGAFSVLVSPKAINRAVQIFASPRDASLTPNTIIPTRLFSGVQVTVPSTPLLLQMGDFGSTVDLTGTVVDADGLPVAGAKVYTERDLQDRNNYSSPFASTDAGGAFTVKALPTVTPGDGVSLWVVPQSGSRAGAIQVVATVPLAGGSIPQPIRCPRRVEVRGQVLRPAGVDPASGVEVMAEPVGAAPGRKTPSTSQESITDMDGRFSLFADPGEYRLDFHSPDALPLVSRRVFVDVQLGPDPVPVEVPAFTLWTGRKLSGSVTSFATPTAATRTALAGASVEVFRVVTEGPKQVVYSLGKTATDLNGHYEVTLPTAPEAPDAGTGGGADGG